MKVRKSLPALTVLLSAILLCVNACSDQVGQSRGMVAALPEAQRANALTAAKRTMRPEYTFQIGDTEVGGLPLNRITGLKPPPATQLQREAQQLQRQNGVNLGEGPGAVPSNFDWTAQRKVTPVKRQLNNDCWAFGTIAPAESCFLIRSNSSDIDLAEECMIDCSGAGTASGGGWWAFSYIQQTGTPSESKYPYEGNDTPCQHPNGTRYYGKSWGYVAPDGGFAQVDDIKRAVMRFGPVATSIYATNLFQWYKSGVFNELPNYHGGVNHAITIVGWDDGKQAWHIKNSWYTNWGEQGYAWVAYGANSIGYGTAWIDMEASPR